MYRVRLALVSKALDCDEPQIQVAISTVKIQSPLAGPTSLQQLVVCTQLQVHTSDLLSPELSKNSDLTFLSVFQRQRMPFHLEPS